MMGQRFHTLDGLRGIAALAIVVRHGPDFFGGNPFPTSYLAVDFFFLLSGFVLAHAYEQRFQSGLGVKAFMCQRLLRLYPIYALSIVLMLAFILAGAGSWSTPDLALTTGFNLAFLPSPLATEPLIALNPAGWSLSFELAVNLAWVLMFRWLTTRVLAVAVSITACLLIWSNAAYGSLDTGWEWATLVGGFARVAFSFPAGVLIYRLIQDAPPIRLHPAVPIGALILVFVPGPGWYDLAAVLVLCPALLIIGARTEAGRARYAFSILGLISYPVYALHFPVLAIAPWVLARLPVISAPWSGFLILAGLICGSVLVVKFYDEPVRKLLAPRLSVPTAEL